MGIRTGMRRAWFLRPFGSVGGRKTAARSSPAVRQNKNENQKKLGEVLQHLVADELRRFAIAIQFREG